MYLHLVIATRAIASCCRMLLRARRAAPKIGSREGSGSHADPVCRHDPPPVIDVGAIGLPGMDRTEPMADLRIWSRVVTHEQLLVELWGPVYVRETQFLRVRASRSRR